jgi:hypothetical protein
MRTFIFAQAAIVPTCEIDRARAADELPTFDIVRNCQFPLTTPERPARKTKQKPRAS